MKHLLRMGAIIVTAFSAFCMGSPPAKAGTNDIRNSDNAVWVSAGADSFNYKESIPAPDLSDSERDWIPSVAAGLNFMSTQDVYFALEGNVSFGDAHYNGAYYYHPTVPLTGTTSETISSVDGRLGKGFVLGEGIMLIPYAELGYRYWNRDLGSDDTEDYQNFDALGGLMLQVSPVNGLILSLYGSGGSTFSAQMKTQGYTYDLGSSAMYKAGGKIGYDIAPRTEIFTTLDYERLSYGQSGVVDDSIEPNSHTNETAVRVGLAYHFQ